VKKGDIFLQVSVNDYGNGKEGEGIDISSTYSRPARGEIDKLHKSNRELGQSKDIDEEFFEELKGIGELESSFEGAFDVEKMRGGRMLNWLMRDSLVGLEESCAFGRLGACFADTWR